MPNSKAKSVARKHRKARNRWKSKNRESLTHAKVKSPPKKKQSVFERAKTSPLTGASPSAVSNPSEGTPRTASTMLFTELKAKGG